MNLEHICQKLVILPSAEKLVQAILALEEKTRLNTIALMWSCWEARNKANAREKKREASEVAYIARALVSDIDNITPELKKCNSRRQKRWNPPPSELLKINIDGAFFEDHKNGGWGFIVRDHDGSAILAGAGKLTVVHDAMCAEA
ncbi:hypothetical protein PR202_ga26377 [Eleusine coracana subsp. coracana]|uniref:RNase H type-1 domain-containing protein n=1 Tax=Eleusine coracana subsp. coracana TaxID=191504 RepID=A0AAV5DEC1_ELECO|nr:hypothetical protein PR202_ga26377 [Eleusine coracana subsp. coracana]